MGTPSVKARDSYPQTPQRKHDKITDAQLPPGCVFADSRCLLDGATQMDRGMEFRLLLLVLLSLFGIDKNRNFPQFVHVIPFSQTNRFDPGIV